MDVVEVLHMNGGIGDTSYANNSSVQQKVILMTKPITEEAIIDIYCSIFPKSVCIADLGCSCGPNTFLAVSELIKTIDKKRRSLGHQSPEFQVYMNDLPCNDFNTIFRALPQHQEALRKQMGSGFGPCFFNGVPGSFYDRLFPTKSLHFVHSSYSLMWLSQVPEGVEGNKGNIYMSTTSPPSVIKAYFNQFQKDFAIFLRCRAQELVAGGGMVLTFLGRRSDDPCSKEGCYIWELLARALNETVSEGLIDEEKLDSFNIPQYTPSPAEVKALVEKEGSFTISRLEASAVHWTANDIEFSGPQNAIFEEGGYKVAKCIRAVTESMLVRHFGEEIIDQVFYKYREIVTECMSKEKTEFINVTVSMKKRK